MPKSRIDTDGDEPTSYLDADAKEELIDILNRIINHQLPTILVVSHDHDWIQRLGWPVGKIAHILKEYLRSHPDYRSPEHKEPLVICKNITEKKAAEEALLPPEYIIFRPWARSIINAAFDKAQHQIKQSMKGSGAMSAKEKNAYKQAERILAGTPHFGSIFSFEKTGLSLPLTSIKN